MNSLHNLVVVSFWIVGSVVVALAGLHFSKRMFQSIDVRANADFLTGAVTIVGTLVSVVLGLLVSSSVDQYRELERCVDLEAVGVADVFRMARALPPKPRVELQNLCIAYCDATISDEWPSMQKAKPSETVSVITAKLNDAILAIQPADLRDANVQRALLDSVKLVGHNRETRVALVRGTWTWKLLPVIILCAILVLALSYLYVDKKPTKLHAVLVSFVAIALGANIGLLITMSRPFDNASCGIEPDSFILTRKVMKTYDGIGSQ